jgi:hypothetical protein
MKRLDSHVRHRFPRNCSTDPFVIKITKSRDFKHGF